MTDRISSDRAYNTLSFPDNNVPVESKGTESVSASRKGSDVSAPSSVPEYGASGASASSSLGSETPELKQSSLKSLSDEQLLSSAGEAVASLTAELMISIQKMIREAVVQGRKQVLDNAAEEAKLIKEQASDIRKSALTKAITNTIDSVIKIGNAAGSAVQTKFAGLDASDAEKAEIKAHNDKVGYINQGINAGAGMVSSIGGAIAGYYDAAMKEKEGKVKELEALNDNIKSMTDEMRQQAQSILSSYQQIRQSEVETLKRIMG